MKKFDTIEDQVFDIIKEKSQAQEKVWINARHIAMLCHIMGWRTSIDDVEMVLGKFLFEGKIQMRFHNTLGEIFHLA